LQAYEKGQGTLAELAERFGVSLGWAKKVSAAYTRTGQTDLPEWRRGPASRVTAAVQDWIRKQIRQQPDVTLRELQQQLEAAQGLRLSIGRLWLALRQLGLWLKKRHSTPRNAIRKPTASAAKSSAKGSARLRRSS